MPQFFEVNQSALDQYVRAIQASGGGKTTNFDKVEIRDFNNVGFKEGDIFKIDSTQKYFRKITINGRTTEVPLLLVTMKDGFVKELYLSMLSRSVNVCDEAGKLADRIDEAGGSVVELWKKYKIASDAVNALDGKYVKVKNCRYPYRLTRDVSGDLVPRKQAIYDFVFCDENGDEIEADN